MAPCTKMRIYPYPASASRAANESDSLPSLENLQERFELLQERFADLVEGMLTSKVRTRLSTQAIDPASIQKLSEQEELIETRLDVLYISASADYEWLYEDTQVALEEFSALIGQVTFECNTQPALKASGA